MRTPAAKKPGKPHGAGLGTLRKVGGSIMLAVPPVLLELLQWRAGIRVGMAAQDGRLVVEPRPTRRYALEELLAQCRSLPERDSVERPPAGAEKASTNKRRAARDREERDWLEAPPTGNELL